MHTTAGFTDSELASFAHETQRRSSSKRAPPPELLDAKRLLRSAPNPRDKSLSSLGQAWCNRFPPDSKPLALCERYARIANRLALCWGDPVLTAMLFQDLLADRRGSRRGFPPDVQRELLALRALSLG